MYTDSKRNDLLYLSLGNFSNKTKDVEKNETGQMKPFLILCGNSYLATAHAL